jgi:hypothetical protein
MKPHPWYYKSGWAVCALALLIIGWRTGAGIIDWAWTATFGPDPASMWTDPTPTHAGSYQWPY